MRIETMRATAEAFKKLAQDDMRRAMYPYFVEMAPPTFTDDDIDNLIEQGMSALEAVLAAYKVIKGRT